MEKFDMGDAFVGAWDIANLTSDFLMEKMGAETSGCSAKAPTSLSSSRCVHTYIHTHDVLTLIAILPSLLFL